MDKSRNTAYPTGQHRCGRSKSAHAENDLRFEGRVDRSTKRQAFVKTPKETKKRRRKWRGNPTVGNFSQLGNFRRPDKARASISFSETNSITSCPRSRSTSATAMPGKRCPPVPPHAITAFIRSDPSISDLYNSYNLLNSWMLNTWRYSDPHGHRFLVRAAQGFPGDKCSVINRYRTCTRPGSNHHN